MHCLVNFAFVLALCAISAVSVGIPFALQGEWDGSVTYTPFDADDNCCDAGTYNVFSQDSSFVVGQAITPLSNNIHAVVTTDSVTVGFVTVNTGATPCEVGFTNFSLTGVTQKNAGLDCYTGTFAFVPEDVNYGSFPCVFKMNAQGEFDLDWIMCYWHLALNKPLDCPGDTTDPDGQYTALRSIEQNRCASFSISNVAYSDWVTNPDDAPWVHTVVPPAPDCTVTAPDHGTLGTCSSSGTIADTDSCHYDCNDGYELQGDAVLVCQEGVIIGLQTCSPLPCVDGSTFSCTGSFPCNDCKVCAAATQTACTATQDTVCAAAGGTFFDAGTAGYATVAPVASRIPSGSSSRTILTYAYLPSTPSTGSTVWSFYAEGDSCDVPQGTELGLGVQYNMGGLTIGVDTCGNGASLSGFTGGDWFYLAVTYDEVAVDLELSVSLDGVSWSSAGEEPPLATSLDHFTIGQRDGLPALYPGLLVKFVRVWDHVLDTAGLSLAVSGEGDCPVFDFDFGAVLPLRDQIDHVYNLTLVGSASVHAPPTPVDCGVLIAPNQCQVGFEVPPACCNRLSSQHPTANATAQGSNLVIDIIANAVPTDYIYAMGLTTDTSTLWTCQAASIVISAVSISQNKYRFTTPLNHLSQCLTTTPTPTGVHFQGFVALSLQFAPWGDDAHLGLYFFSINIEVVNTTQAVTLLTVVPELDGDGLDVELIPTGTLRHCASIPCTTNDPNYFSRVGASEIYMVVVDTGGKAASVRVDAVVFEDGNHVQQGVLLSPTILDNSGLDVTFAFTVPSGTESVRFIRVSCTVDFFGPASFTFETQANGKTFLAQSRFEIQGASTSSAVTSSALLVALLVLAALAF